MNKIKIIDLLNMISKGEEVPKRIKYCLTNFKYDSYKNEYLSIEDETNNGNISIFKYMFTPNLNDEVEILEEEPYVEVCGGWFTKSEYDKLFLKEEKKIPKKLPIGLKQTKDGIFNTIVKDDIHYELNEKEEMICKKIHEIIDYLDYLKSKDI